MLYIEADHTREELHPKTIVTLLGSLDSCDDELNKLKLQLKHDNRHPRNILADIVIAIQKARLAITQAKSRQAQINRQYEQVKTESNILHEQALESALKGDQTLAVQSLIGEINHRKLADVLHPQIDEQRKTIKLLEENLESLIDAEFIFKKYIGVLVREYEVDVELKTMKAQVPSSTTSSPETEILGDEESEEDEDELDSQQNQFESTYPRPLVR